MYSFMGIRAILEKLLSFKVIATLRDPKQNKKHNKQTNNDERVKQRIYDKVIYSTIQCNAMQCNAMQHYVTQYIEIIT